MRKSKGKGKHTPARAPSGTSEKSRRPRSEGLCRTVLLDGVLRGSLHLHEDGVTSSACARVCALGIPRVLKTRVVLLCGCICGSHTRRGAGRWCWETARCCAALLWALLGATGHHGAMRKSSPGRPRPAAMIHMPRTSVCGVFWLFRARPSDQRTDPDPRDAVPRSAQRFCAAGHGHDLYFSCVPSLSHSKGACGFDTDLAGPHGKFTRAALGGSQFSAVGVAVRDSERVLRVYDVLHDHPILDFRRCVSHTAVLNIECCPRR